VVGEVVNQSEISVEMNIVFKKLTTPTPEIAASLTKWANDPLLIPVMRPSRDKEELEKPVSVTVESLTERLEKYSIYLIYADGRLVGEMNFQIDPDYLFKREAGTAWIGIGIGEASARGKGVGARAMKYLEEQIQAQGLSRIELGVFEFNAKALRLYRKAGYQEIGRIDDFTYWQGRMWQDIRMEKYL
jgi:RimJ/RimL family protein N-acetyltransferase